MAGLKSWNGRPERRVTVGLFCSFPGLLGLFWQSAPFVFNTFCLHCKKTLSAEGRACLPQVYAPKAGA
jgi:hypothetical protein